MSGTIVATALVGLFMVFGSAIGLSAISIGDGQEASIIWLVITALWAVITLTASYLAGGYISGRMRRRLDDAAADEVAAGDGSTGLVVWGLGMLITAWMTAGTITGAASAGGTAAGYVLQATGAAPSGAGPSMAQVLGAATPNDAEEDALTYINDTLMRATRTAPQPPVDAANPATTSSENAELVQQSAVVLANLLRSGCIPQEDRSFLIAAVTQRTGLDQAEAEARVDQAIEAVQNTRAEAEWLAAEAAAVIGAEAGDRHRDNGQIFAGFSHRH